MQQAEEELKKGPPPGYEPVTTPIVPTPIAPQVLPPPVRPPPPSGPSYIPGVKEPEPVPEPVVEPVEEIPSLPPGTPEVSQTVEYYKKDPRTGEHVYGGVVRTTNINIPGTVHELEDKGYIISRVLSDAAPGSRSYQYTYQYDPKYHFVKQIREPVPGPPDGIRPLSEITPEMKQQRAQQKAFEEERERIQARIMGTPEERVAQMALFVSGTFIKPEYTFRTIGQIFTPDEGKRERILDILAMQQIEYGVTGDIHEIPELFTKSYEFGGWGSTVTIAALTRGALKAGLPVLAGAGSGGAILAKGILVALAGGFITATGIGGGLTAAYEKEGKLQVGSTAEYVAVTTGYAALFAAGAKLGGMPKTQIIKTPRIVDVTKPGLAYKIFGKPVLEPKLVDITPGKPSMYQKIFGRLPPTVTDITPGKPNLFQQVFGKLPPTIYTIKPKPMKFTDLFKQFVTVEQIKPKPMKFTDLFKQFVTAKEIDPESFLEPGFKIIPSELRPTVAVYQVYKRLPTQAMIQPGRWIDIMPQESIMVKEPRQIFFKPREVIGPTGETIGYKMLGIQRSDIYLLRYGEWELVPSAKYLKTLYAPSERYAFDMPGVYKIGGKKVTMIPGQTYERTMGVFSGYDKAISGVVYGKGRVGLMPDVKMKVPIGQSLVKQLAGTAEYSVVRPGGDWYKFVSEQEIRFKDMYGKQISRITGVGRTIEISKISGKFKGHEMTISKFEARGKIDVWDVSTGKITKQVSLKTIKGKLYDLTSWREYPKYTRFIERVMQGLTVEGKIPTYLHPDPLGGMSVTQWGTRTISKLPSVSVSVTRMEIASMEPWGFYPKTVKTTPTTILARRPVTLTTPVIKPIVSPIMKTIVFPVIKPIVQPVTKPIVQPVIKPMTWSITKPVTKSVIKPMTRSITKPVTKVITKPIVEPIVYPVIEPIVFPVIKPIVQPVIKLITKPITKPSPPGPKPPPILLGVPLIKEKRERIKPEQAYNVMVKDRYIFAGKKVKPEKFIKANKKPLSMFDALSLGGTVTDNSAARSFKITPTSGKPKEPSIQVDPWSRLMDKFRRKDDMFIEKTQHAIDSFGEVREIPARGWIAEQRRLTPKHVTVSRGRRKRTMWDEMFGFNMDDMFMGFEAFGF